MKVEQSPVIDGKSVEKVAEHRGVQLYRDEQKLYICRGDTVVLTVSFMDEEGDFTVHNMSVRQV